MSKTWNFDQPLDDVKNQHHPMKNEQKLQHFSINKMKNQLKK